eukprot:6542837-Pyramimonas_sp.AAC.1
MATESKHSRRAGRAAWSWSANFSRYSHFQSKWPDTSQACMYFRGAALVQHLAKSLLRKSRLPNIKAMLSKCFSVVAHPGRMVTTSFKALYNMWSPSAIPTAKGRKNASTPPA